MSWVTPTIWERMLGSFCTPACCTAVQIDPHSLSEHGDAGSSSGEAETSTEQSWMRRNKETLETSGQNSAPLTVRIDPRRSSSWRFGVTARRTTDRPFVRSRPPRGENEARSSWVPNSGDRTSVRDAASSPNGALTGDAYA